MVYPTGPSIFTKRTLLIQIAPNFLGSLLVGASFEAGRHGDSAAPHPANLRSVAKDGDGPEMGEFACGEWD
jgi:hypothetical protein